MEQKHTGFSPESLRLIGAALALQHVERTAASITPIPSAGRFVVIGTPAEVARLLEIAPASADNPSTAGAAKGKRENKELASILFGMIEGGGEDRDKDIYAADYQAVDGDTYVYRAAELLVEQDAEIDMLIATIDLLSAKLASTPASQAKPLADEVRNAVLDEAIAVVPGGSVCDPQQVADAIRALKGQSALGEKGGE